MILERLVYRGNEEGGSDVLGIVEVSREELLLIRELLDDRNEEGCLKKDVDDVLDGMGV